MKGYYKLSWRERTGYCSGELALNLIYQTVSIWLMFYYTNVYGLKPSIAAMLFLVVRIIDVVWDPFVGTFVDRAFPKDIINAVGNKIHIFVDCGIESGMDAYKCLAMGAKAVSVGRHLMPLLKGGSDAVAARMQEMTEELSGVMARTGIANLASMDPTVIHKRKF